MEKIEDLEPREQCHFHGWFNEVTGQNDSANIYYIHDVEDGKRIGFRKWHNRDGVEVIFHDPFNHDDFALEPKLLGVITVNEAMHVAKFITDHKISSEPATAEEELMLLRKIAAVNAELQQWLNRPDKTETQWKKQGYISKVVPGHTIASALTYLHLQYKFRFPTS